MVQKLLTTFAKMASNNRNGQQQYQCLHFSELFMLDYKSFSGSGLYQERSVNNRADLIKYIDHGRRKLKIVCLL